MSRQILCPRHDKQANSPQGIRPFGAAEKCRTCDAVERAEVYSLLRRLTTDPHTGAVCVVGDLKLANRARMILDANAEANLEAR